MGVSSSARYEEARQPFVNSAAPSAPPLVYRTSEDEDGEQVCSICIGPLSCASVFTLPLCGHTCHALCLASALQISSACPICRLPVDGDVQRQVARALTADSGGAGSSQLAAEITADLKRNGQRTSASTESVHSLLAALRRVAEEGDASRIPFVATLMSQQSSSEVRLAAVETLRVLASRARILRPGPPRGLEILQCACLSNDEDDVRMAALQAIRSVSPLGEESSLEVVSQLLRGAASPDVRVLASDVLQSLAIRGQPCSIRVAMAALQDPDSSVRSAALNTLRTICPRGSCEPAVLKEIGGLASGSNLLLEVQCAALDLLGHVGEAGEPYSLHVASAVLRNDSAREEAQQAALAAFRRLAPRGNSKAVEILASVVKSSRQDWLQCACLDELANVAERGDPVAVGAAVGALGNDEIAAKQAAKQALKQLCTRGDRSLMEQLLALVMGQSLDVEGRAAAIEVLGCVTVHDDKVIDILRGFRDDQEDSIKMAAEQALLRAS
mmetsp:Transcript_63266/g.137636  ORF Transcript_63266/g.137636 Transcript_63266/m.137636 type:complete len:500 (-) Transcript_63266:75-1574(-)